LGGNWKKLLGRQLEKITFFPVLSLFNVVSHTIFQHNMAKDLCIACARLFVEVQIAN
jgi:hypothetical protein